MCIRDRHEDVADGQHQHGQNKGKAFALDGGNQLLRGLEQFRMPFPDAVAVPGEHRAPDKRAEHGDQGKDAEAHADNACGNGDQVPDDGQKAGEENA